jgi:hypothetical protein
MRDEGDMIGEWHQGRRSHEPIREIPTRYTSWGIAWRICVGILAVYVLITAALVLTGA